MAILELRGASKSYGAADVLKGIDLSVEDGEFVVILGFSGTGKTTLINLLAGLETPDAARLSIGTRRSRRPTRRARWCSSPTR